MASTLPSRTFLLIFWFLPVFVVVLLFNDTVVMCYRINDLSMTNILIVLLKHISYDPLQCFYCLSLKAIEFNGVDTNGFLSNFVVLMYLFLFIDILKSYRKKKAHAVKTLMDDSKSLPKSYFLKASTLSLIIFLNSRFLLIFLIFR